MDIPAPDYRARWRQRRRQQFLRRIPLVVGPLVALAAIVVVSLRARKPELGVVAWAHGDGSRGMPRIGLGPGVLAVAWERGALTAHSLDTGEPLWPEPFERAREFEGPPTVGPDCIVFGGMDGQVRCIDLATGLPRWGYDAEALVRSKPLIVGDRVYVGADDGRLAALPLDPDAPRPAWIYPPPEQADRGPILGGAAVWGDTIVYGSGDRSIYGLDLKTGAGLWRRIVGAPVVARVTTAAGRAYVVAEGGSILCLQAATGEQVWQVDTSALVRFPVLIHGGNAYVFASDGSVTCLDSAWGRIRWKRTLDGRPTTSAVADSARIYVGTSDGIIQALTHPTGKTVWRWRPGAKPLGDLALANDRLYCATNTGRVFCVRLNVPAR